MNVRNLGADYPWIGPTGKPLRIVILDCLYDTIHEPLTQKLLGRIAALKIEGYQKEHQYGALPLDAADFVATHLLLCEEDAGELYPFMGFKSLRLSRCELHKIEFPALHLGHGESYVNHQLAVKNYLSMVRQSGEEAGYNGSWTISPAARKNKELVRLCWDVTLMLMVFHYHTAKIKHIIAGATLNFKVDEFKKFMGFTPLLLDKQPLPAFDCDVILGGQVLLMVLERFSPGACALAEKYQKQWENRLVIADDHAFIERKKAA